MLAGASKTQEQSPAPTSRGVECRIWPRFDCDMPASCQPLASRTSSDAMWSATVRNISVGGIGLVVDRRFERGTSLFIECQAEGTESRGPFMARVVHATPQAGEMWLIGCAFIRQLNAEELQEFLRAASEQVHRQTSRPAEIDRLTVRFADANSPQGIRKGGSTTVLLAGVMLETVTASGGTARALARRLSLSGPWPPPAGTALHLSAAGPGAKTAAAQVRVLGSSQQDGRWTLRYEFTESPAAAVLSAFGCAESKEQAT
jgi:hypothetical protein